MKSLIAVLLAFILQGCMWQTISTFEIARAEKLCASKDLVVEEMASFAWGEIKVKCSDGQIYPNTLKNNGKPI